MDNYLNFFIKKSDISKPTNKSYAKPKTQFTYSQMPEPTAHSYVVFDLETTGMNPTSDRIIEIGAIKVENDSITGTFNTLINPETFISSFITNIVHITNDMVRNKPTISLVLPKFYDFIGELPIIAHNAKFDTGFIAANYQRANLTLDNPIIDTLYLSRKYNKECEKHNLAYLTDYFDINLKNAHRAYFDALATYELYKIIQQKYYGLINA